MIFLPSLSQDSKDMIDLDGVRDEQNLEVAMDDFG